MLTLALILVVILLLTLVLRVSIIAVVSLDKSTMVEEIVLFKAFKLASMVTSILIDCGVSLGSEVKAT